MQHHIGGEAAKSRTSRSSRSSSVGSDAVPSPIVTNLRPVPAAKPRPAYVAVAAASELITANRQLALEEDAYDLASPPSPSPIDNATFSEAGLAMVNAFLDQLLYNFLFHARTTTLAALRQSVEQVLKGKLAAYAIASADDELEELLNEELDEDLAAVYESASGTSKGDVEAIFWRTRLRVMVYMRLGEMEDEDEEQHVDDAQALLHKSSSDKKRLSLTTGLVSWAAAIFLTSILEFVAEQCLNAAGQAAFDRVAAKRRAKGGPTNDDEESVVVEEHDTERVALSSTLGRLWRTWRKGLRTPHSRNISSSSSRKPSTGALYPDVPGRAAADGAGMLSRLAMQNSAEVARGSNPPDEGAKANAVRISRILERPRSLLIESPRIAKDNRGSRILSTSDPLQQNSTIRKRARSLPNPERVPFTSPPERPPSTDGRRKASPNVVEGTSSVSNNEDTPLPIHETASESQADEEAISEQRALTSQSLIGASHKSLNNVDKTVTTRKPVPIRQDSLPQNTSATSTSTGEQASPNSTDSLTSIDEDLESQTAGSTEATETSNATTSGLGIHSDPAVSRAIASPVADDASLEDSPPPTHVQPRSPQYHDQHIVRAVSSFEREEKSSVRLLSNGSSQRSRSTGAARLTGKHSQEALGSPSSAATSRSEHFERGFQEFMAGEETVKYTLTPRTLQEIESPYSPRYKVQEIGRVSSDGRKVEQVPESKLVAAQKAVIESMNASLRNFPPSGRSRSGSANVYTSQAMSTPPVPPIPLEAGGSISAPLKSASVTGSRSEADNTSGSQTQGAYNGRSSLSQQRSPPGATPSTGWFSARTSSEVARSAKSNGTASGRNFPGSSSSAASKQNVMLQPREAVTGRRGENADLVEFLRSTGPPGPQLYAGPNGRYPESNTISAAKTSSSATRSASGSITSHSGLIGANGTRVAGGRSGAGRGAATEAEGGAPARTRRRVKDPYALPSDDEDEEGLTALPTRGESLVEFLRNVQPPPSLTSTGTATASPIRTMGGETHDARSQNGSWGSNRPSTPGSSPGSKALKGKGSVKSLWKKIGV